ncbi:tRNA (adenosine(37)-N6)-threonylcarbamoyltransferase complex ATPase subunit type 1 TsaE [uncultured Porphyromonas sp.]|jgi:hydrolase, P-loop family|uniref:tRNA (adenosine(37)-N6)-threonylcarbamoyltransferase complex ATPase subunit type 1 TsaE n=1 Tax=uncultured Porphyromonas sp. TaxID=159274 RepID=UPI00261A0CBD|nr:tRNA (adenosine(37)-N6)-threonylcarbamoyltransferase complex ATPase subunit type 1 TsaE [uncultured Porphyromonas sp.]
METETIYLLPDVGALPEVAQQFIQEVLPWGDVFAFYAPMGTGKTTFIKALCEELGVTDVINSPTFSIINEYRAEPSGELIYHFDCYRLEQLSDALSLGAEDYLQSGALCFIEWPEVIEDILPADTVHVTLEELEGGVRKLTARYRRTED